MAKITIVGDALVVTSAKTLKDIQTLEKYNPKALALFETDEDTGKKVEVFRIESTTKGEGSLNKYGASFASTTHDEAKLATISMLIPAGTDDVKQYAAEKFGPAIMLLNRVEAQFDAALQGVEAEKQAILQNITVA